MAQEPKATSIFDFWRRSLARCSFSELRTAPWKRVTSMAPSSISSTWWYLKSVAMGQRTISASSATLRMYSWTSSTATSQPPHAAPQ